MAVAFASFIMNIFSLRKMVFTKTREIKILSYSFLLERQKQTMSTPQWLGLLKWTLANSDGTAMSSATQMDENDKLWLERVLKVHTCILLFKYTLPPYISFHFSGRC